MFHENVQQQSSYLDDKNSCVTYLSPSVGKFLASNVHPALRRYLPEELSECLDGKRPARLRLYHSLRFSIWNCRGLSPL